MRRYKSTMDMYGGRITGGNANGNGGGGAITQDYTSANIAPIDVPELNKGDHVAYIVGYADGNVRPMRWITRAEVTTVFFRLQTDESRAALGVSKNLFGTLGDCREGSKDKQLSSVGVHRYGKTRVAQ